MNHELNRGDVILWSLRFEQIDPSVVAAFRRSLPEEERVRADRFYFERDRSIYIAAHAMLHAMLGAYGAPMSRFRFNQWGKPEIDALGNILRFNLTHTHGLAACAIALVDDVGVDAEVADRAVDCVAFANEFFAPMEARYIAALPKAGQEAAFFRIWTLKEAFIKAVGEGLSMRLADFAFALEPFSFDCVPSLEQVAWEWCFESLTLGATHHVALALHRRDGQAMVLRHRILTLEELTMLAREWPFVPDSSCSHSACASTTAPRRHGCRVIRSRSRRPS